MIIERYLVKEVSLNFLAVLFVIVLIFGGNHFVRFMEAAAAGTIPADYIFKLLGIFILSQLMLLIPGALYIAVLITVGRWYRDNEITAMLACGVGLRDIVKPVAFIGVVAALGVAVLSLWVTPWAERATYELRMEAKAVSEFNAIAPGRFHRIAKGKGVFYIEDTDRDTNQLENVFVFLEGEQGLQMFAATEGRQKTADDIDFLQLDKGSLLQMGKQDDVSALVKYENAEIRLDRSDYLRTRIKAREKPLEELFGASTSVDNAELQWRFSIPVACFLLVMVAFLLSKTNPRQGRFGKLFVAVLIYVVYIYSLILGKAWVGKEGVSFGLLMVHVTVIIGLLLLTRSAFGFKRKTVGA